jgi:hypothetical protein
MVCLEQKANSLSKLKTKPKLWSQQAENKTKAEHELIFNACGEKKHK